MNPLSGLFYCLPLAFLGDIGGGEVMVVLAAILMLFGGKGLPGIARNMGKVAKDLKRASDDFKSQLLSADIIDEPEPPPPETSEWAEAAEYQSPDLPDEPGVAESIPVKAQEVTGSSLKVPWQETHSPNPQHDNDHVPPPEAPPRALIG